MKQRIVSGVVGGIIFLTMVYVGNAWYSWFVLMLAIIGLFEFLSMTGIRPVSVPGLLSYALLVSIMWPQLYIGTGLEISLSPVLVSVMILLLFYSVYRKNKFHIEHAALAIMGALYIGFGFVYMLSARNVPENGLFLTMLVFLGIWSTDSGAYFVGRAIGKRKLWPEISPNKTVEGAVGGLILALLVVAGVNLLFDAVSLAQALAIGLVAGILGQIGDLIESALKRHYGVKDSGNIMPGHGGVLDRCDSWLIVFPILHLLQLIG
ncbi:phosphatidate cytidylyltransferase [Brevibacillus migulae]|uniref:phosphatidate cytidylyltransferase n=1 Tax=Brevibacillus migulae TaxID=1644114 RepID=UPI00106E781B|nr:phosphatidate cytidylyltransferase [Brevibacillus migulae]